MSLLNSYDFLPFTTAVEHKAKCRRTCKEVATVRFQKVLDAPHQRDVTLCHTDGSPKFQPTKGFIIGFGIHIDSGWSFCAPMPRHLSQTNQVAELLAAITVLTQYARRSIVVITNAGYVFKGATLKVWMVHIRRPVAHVELWSIA